MGSRHIWQRAALLVALLVGVPTGSRADVVINEVLASNRFFKLDEDGDSSDWLELTNTGSEAVDLGGYTLTDDPAVPFKWTFPAISIPPGGFLLVWLSGKDRFVPPPEVLQGSLGALAFDAVFIGDEEQWRYLVGGPVVTGPPALWNTPGFDDSAWMEGPAGFGYGDGDDATELPDQTGAVFVRRTFTLANPATLTNLVLQVDYDDGFVAYLNGRRVASRNAAPTEPVFSSVATGKHEAGAPERFDLTPFLGELIPGANVLALAGLNGLPSSDMSLSPQLGIVPLIVHASFQLDRAGESLLLSDAEGEVVDQVQFPPQTEDHSYGRSPDGAGDWFYFLTPTPAAPNTSTPFLEPLADRVALEPPPGLFPARTLQITMSAGLTDQTVIHYTTDGSEPDASSPVYRDPIAISANRIFRVAGFIENERATRVESASYFLGVSHDLPILSISMDPGDYATVHNTAGGRGRASERPSHMEYFEPDGTRVVSTGFGTRLHGGAGRNGGFEVKKSYRAYFRRAYGDSRLRYPIIPDTPVEEFDKLVLRAGFNDSFRTNGGATYLRDQLFRDLHEDMGAPVSHGSWCMLYANMKFRGLFNIVERMDEEFLASYFEGNDWDVIKTGNDVLVGSIDEWNRLRNFVVSNDLSEDALYEQALELLDIENFTSYMILNIWGQNHDWPHNNWYAARRRVPDGRWIFLSWDAEFGIALIPTGFTANTFEFVFTRGGYLRDILENLLANENYRRYFLAEAERHVQTSLGPGNVLSRISRLEAIVRPDIAAELSIFGRTLSQWDSNVARMESFARNRGSVFLDHLRNSSRFDFPETLDPVISGFSPATLVNTGDVVVTIFGLNLDADTRVFLDDLEAEDVEVSGDNLRVPIPLEVTGEVTLRVEDPETGKSFEAREPLVVALPVPQPREILPAEGSAAGGDIVTIRGRYFVEGVDVLFGGVPSPDVRLAHVPSSPVLLREIEAVTPPGRGAVDVVIANNLPWYLVGETALTYTYRGPRYRRGDPNLDTVVDLSDGILILGHLFLGDPVALACQKSADLDDSGTLELTDAVVLIGHVFLSDPTTIAEPFARCGEDPSDDTLTCESFPLCDASLDGLR